MLFARTYATLTNDYVSIRKEINEDMHRGHSWWAGDYQPSLGYEPKSVVDPLFDEDSYRKWVETLPETAKEGWKEPIHPVPGWRLAGLCAACSASSYRELAQRIWRDFYSGSGWMRGRGSRRIIAIFEGELVGADPDGWPLFTARKLLAIADISAIVGEAAARPSGLGPAR